MRVTGVTTNLPVADIDAARSFYTDYLGLSVEDLNLGWVARYVSPDGRACVQLVTDAQVLRTRDLGPRRERRRRSLRGSAAPRLRDRSSTDRRTLGCPQVLRARSRRERDQHRQPPRPVAPRPRFTKVAILVCRHRHGHRLRLRGLGLPGCHAEGLRPACSRRWASATAMAVMLTTSLTEASRCMTWTVFDSPLRIGPITSASPRRLSSL